MTHKARMEMFTPRPFQQTVCIVCRRAFSRHQQGQKTCGGRCYSRMRSLDRATVFARDDFRCVVCDRQLKPHLLELVGGPAAEDCQTVCRICVRAHGVELPSVLKPTEEVRARNACVGIPDRLYVRLLRHGRYEDVDGRVLPLMEEREEDDDGED